MIICFCMVSHDDYLYELVKSKSFDEDFNNYIKELEMFDAKEFKHNCIEALIKHKDNLESLNEIAMRLETKMEVKNESNN